MFTPRYGSDEILRCAQDDNGNGISLERTRFRGQKSELDAWRGLAKILRQASDGFPVVCFVLHAIESAENAGVGSRAANLRSRPSDRAEANRRRVFAKMG